MFSPKVVHSNIYTWTKYISCLCNEMVVNSTKGAKESKHCTSILWGLI